MGPKRHTAKVHLGEMPLIEEPFRRDAVELIRLLSPMSDKGNWYILTVVDIAMRYVEAVALPCIEAEHIAQSLLEIFCRLGMPQQILRDHRMQFTLEVMQEVSMLVSMKQLFTTPYNPAETDFVRKSTVCSRAC